MKLKETNAPILQIWDNIANIYNDKFMDLDLYDDTYDAFIQSINKPNASIFEIGCGPGNITRYFLRKQPDFNITGIDLSSNMIELAKQNNPNAKFEVMDCRDIDRINEKYDGIVCGFCLPYLSKEETAKLVKDCANLLNQEGLLYLSAIEDDYKKSGYETSSDGRFKMFVYFHQADFLEECFSKNGFELMEIKRKIYPKPGDRKDTHLIYIARKKG
ncbi:MAG: methyltransferase domain-containing protein [Bacteroidetes bacterium]|nr:methyltransferase domain-containing protein [Bacteroidota bacterium]